MWAGWGHASENPRLPRGLEKSKIAFMGPHEKAMHDLGDKIASTLVFFFYFFFLLFLFCFCFLFLSLFCFFCFFFCWFFFVLFFCDFFRNSVKILFPQIAQSAKVPCVPWSGDGIIINYERDGLNDEIFQKACISSLEDLQTQV